MLLRELSSPSFHRSRSTAAFLAASFRHRAGDLVFFSSATAFTAGAASAGVKPSPKPHFMAEYLVSSCDFSPEKAMEVSKLLTRIKSPQQPDSVLGFLRNQGFDETQVKKLVSWNPRLLYRDLETSLKPTFQALRDLGFSDSDLAYLVFSNPVVLIHSFERTVLPKIELWKRLLGSVEHLIKFLRKNHWLLGYSVEKTILPNLALLRDCGVSEERISMAVKRRPRFIAQRPELLRAAVDRVEQLGIPRYSGMFLWALLVIRMVNRNSFEAKMELMKSLGWSESEFLSAFRKAPTFLSVSERMVRRKMEFFVKEAGCEPSYLACHPVLLMLSLEKRLIPRYHAMEILKSKGLYKGDGSLHYLMHMSEEKFIKRFVICHEKEVPELLKMFVAGSSEPISV